MVFALATTTIVVFVVAVVVAVAMICLCVVVATVGHYCIHDSVQASNFSTLQLPVSKHNGKLQG